MRNSKIALFLNVAVLGSSSTASAGTALKADLALDEQKKSPANIEEVNVKCSAGDDSKQPYCRLQCQYANVICIDPTGAPIPSEVLPATLDPRTTIQLFIVKLKTDETNSSVRITEVIGKDSAEKLTVRPSDKAGAGWRTLDDQWVAWGTSFTMAGDAESERFDVFIPEKTVVTTPAGGGSPQTTKTEEQKLSSFLVRSNGGYFYYSFGPMLAIPFAGTQKIISAQPPDGTTDRYVRVYDTDILPSFAVHLYPGGHRAQSSTPLEHFALTPAGLKSFVRDAFSIEVGVSIIPKEVFDHLFIGGAFEPITGFTTSVGLSVHRGERYRNGYQDGAFPAASRDSAIEEFAALRGYVGFGVNQKIFSTIANAFSSPAGSQETAPKN